MRVIEGREQKEVLQFFSDNCILNYTNMLTSFFFVFELNVALFTPRIFASILFQPNVVSPDVFNPFIEMLIRPRS